MYNCYLVRSLESSYVGCVFDDNGSSAALTDVTTCGKWCCVLRVWIMAMSVAASFACEAKCDEDGDLVFVRVPAQSSGEYDNVAAADIASMEAEMYNIPTFPAKLPNVERFQVPASEYQTVLDYFSLPEVDGLPRIRWPEIGSIKITLRNGTVKRVSYYWSGGKGLLRFSLNGVRLISGRRRGVHIDEALTLDSVLRGIRLKVKTDER